MIVCANGDVAGFCEQRDMVICEQYEGNLEDYRGNCAVLVTDHEMTQNEYYYIKSKLLGRGVELVSTRYTDDAVMTGFLAYMAERRRKTYGGRQMFGFYRKNGEVLPREESLVVVRRIFELKDRGYTLRSIREDSGVHHPDGRKLSISTIQQIIKNREKYERK